MAILSEAMIGSKAGWFTVALTAATNWWVDWGSVAADMVATLLTITLTTVLIIINIRTLMKTLKRNTSKKDVE